MNNKFEITLDELIDFVLTDKYMNYSENEMHELKKLMYDKLKNISDDDEKEFYSGVIEGLLIEITENIVGKNVVYNPLKGKYDSLNKRIYEGLKAVEYKSNISKYIRSNSYKFTLYDKDVISLMASKMFINGSAYFFPNGMSQCKGEGENSDDLLTELGFTKKR